MDMLAELNELDQEISANRQELNNGFIKIPFSKYRLFDDVGIIKHNIPTLLERDHKQVVKYNSLLEQYKSHQKQTTTRINNLAEELKIVVDGNYCEKLAKIIKVLDVSEKELGKTW
ncbi:MAG: hypothetical protein Q4E15_08725 [Lactobacillus johnsonii]|nr:hypothetical protein [Lactobacillus johnsonii]